MKYCYLAFFIKILQWQVFCDKQTSDKKSTKKSTFFTKLEKIIPWNTFRVFLGLEPFFFWLKVLVNFIPWNTFRECSLDKNPFLLTVLVNFMYYMGKKGPIRAWKAPLLNASLHIHHHYLSLTSMNRSTLTKQKAVSKS